MTISDIISQAGILVFGCSAIWFVSRREKWRRWGYILGMASVPFWFWTAVANQQYGIVAINFIYAYSWGQGVWNFWVRPCPLSRSEPPAPPGEADAGEDRLDAPDVAADQSPASQGGAASHIAKEEDDG